MPSSVRKNTLDPKKEYGHEKKTFLIKATYVNIFVGFYVASKCSCLTGGGRPLQYPVHYFRHGRRAP
jgi:hypothetical protein